MGDKTYQIYPHFQTTVLSAVKGHQGKIPHQCHTAILRGAQMIPEEKPWYYFLGKIGRLDIFAPLETVLYRQYYETLYESDNVLVLGEVSPVAFVLLSDQTK